MYSSVGGQRASARCAMVTTRCSMLTLGATFAGKLRPKLSWASSFSKPCESVVRKRRSAMLQAAKDCFSAAYSSCHASVLSCTSMRQNCFAAVPA